ncbi:MAG: metallophosphoesterase, partial [Bacteroidota bacterium]
MKLGQTLIFFGIVFTIYGLINFYLFKRILSVIPASFKSATSIILIFIILSYIAGRVLENFWISHISDFLVWLGAFWIAIMFYAFLLVVLIDLVRLLNHFLPFLPAALIKSPEKLKRTCALIVSVLVFIAVAGGFFNSKMIAEKKYTLAINKKAGKLKTLNIVMVSDLHLGTIIGNKFLEHVVSRINNLKPDIILFAGDVIDEDIKPVLKDNFGATLLKLKSKYGVYAVTGNHEYIGGVNEAVNYLREHGITMVRDEALL